MRPQNIKVGQFIIISGYREREEEDEEQEGSMWGFFGRSAPWKRPNDFTGAPFLVRAVNLPFLLVEGLNSSTTLDVRLYAFTPATDEYVANYKKMFDKTVAAKTGAVQTSTSDWVNAILDQTRECNGR